MNDPRAAGIDDAAQDTRPGFRLKRLEVLDWGAFDGQVWTLELAGRSALLTGDIGAGTSSIVEAVTSLLAPARRCARDEAVATDLRAGVPGGSRSEGDDRADVQLERLRVTGGRSVILGVFRNEACDETVTLAQVFWMREPQGAPACFFVGAERELGIAEHFTQSGSDIDRLRGHLLDLRCEIDDTWRAHGAWIRRRLGIGDEQAPALVCRTASLSPAGSLTDFVRDHLLQPFDVAPRLAALMGHFDALEQAREAMVTAKRDAQMLPALAADSDRHAELCREIEELRECREGLGAHFARIKLRLLDDRLARFGDVVERLDVQIGRLEARRDERRMQADELRRAAAAAGGERIERLGADILRLEALRDSRRLKAERYGALVRRIGEPASTDEAAFFALRTRLKSMRNEARDRDAALDGELTEHHVALRQVVQEHDALRDEVESLGRRRSNVDAQQAQIRSVLCGALGIAEDALPFAGELLQVREEERAWEGAAERLLRDFGLSLLVPDAYFEAVAAWVDGSHLPGRLVYFRVGPLHGGDLPDLHPDSLVRKLSIRPDSPFGDWMARELAQRFDFACCATQEQFRREGRAITPDGRIKDAGGRHEKDDRHRIDDRRRYVLGWSTADKLAALETRARLVEVRMKEIGDRIARVQEQRKLLGERLDALVRLEEIVEFDDLDWGAVAREIETLDEERGRLAQASDRLRQLDERLAQTSIALEATEKELDVAKARRTRIRQHQSEADGLRNLAQAVLAGAASRTGRLPAERLAQLLEAARSEALGSAALPGVEDCDDHERATDAHLQRRLDDAASACRGLLERLHADDLTRLETRFVRLLDVDTVDAIANFEARLARDRETLLARVGRIDESLSRIEFEPGRHIVLEAEPSPDPDVRDFQAALRACSEAAVTRSGEALAPEAKFLRVKALFDRLCGRDGSSGHDRQWTAKVTDVRNWFVFAASERRRADASACGHRGDADDRMERVVCTLLAASLADQLAPAGQGTPSRSFRFLLVDEGFARGSDESARYGLRLFRQLDLQLLVVAPPEKIHVVEPCVSAVVFVQTEGGRVAALRNLAVEAYRAHGSPSSPER